MSAFLRDSHPALVTEFDHLERVFGQSIHSETIQRVLARCCFLNPTQLPVHILNTGERSGGTSSTSLHVTAPPPVRSTSPEPVAKYVCEWIKEMEDWHLLTDPWTGHDGEEYKTMTPALQRAVGLLLFETNPALLFHAFHAIVLTLRCLFPGHVPTHHLTASPPEITTNHRRLLGNHIVAALQGYATFLEHSPWSGGNAQRLSAVRTLQGLLNDLGWYHIQRGDFADARYLGAVAEDLTADDLFRAFALQEPEMAQGPFPGVVFHQDLDTKMMCAYAWAWNRLEELEVRAADSWFSVVLPDDVLGDERFVFGHRQAERLWGEVVGMVRGWVDWEGGGSGTHERVLERLEHLYGGGRRMAVFWQSFDVFDWDLQVELREARRS